MLEQATPTRPSTGPVSHRREETPRVRPALMIVMAAAAVVYAWHINRMSLHLYYGPAVRTMAQSWSSLWFGAFDPEQTLTLDKIPGTFWPQALLVRFFGYHSWVVLLPSLAACVGAVGVLHRIVRRWAGASAAIAAALFYAATPLIGAVARTQVPDPLLVFLLLLAAMAWQSAMLSDRWAPLLWCGVWIGVAFQVKMGQAWLLWLVLGLPYLVGAPWRGRFWRLLTAGLVTVAVSALWVVPMMLTPARSRPWIDGSVTNSVLPMVFGYNGFNRYGVDYAGEAVLGVGGPLGRSDGPEWLYLARDTVAPQIGWLYPVALTGFVVGLVHLRGIRRTTTIMWGLWLAVHTLVFAVSLKPHGFYNLILVAPLAALSGAGLHVMWTRYRDRAGDRWLLPLTVAATGAWGWYLAGTSAYAQWLPAAVLIAVGGATVFLVVGLFTDWLRAPAMVLATLAMMVAPGTWTASVMDNSTVVDAHRPSAGPPSLEVATVLSGRMLRMLPSADVELLSAYAKTHAAGVRYQLAVQWSPQAGQFLVRNVAVLPVGGFTAQLPTITPEQLDALRANGDLRYALVDGPDLKGKVTPDYPGYAQWVTTHCAALPEFTQPLYTLYDCV